MRQIQFTNLFKDSFNTFKVFDTITLKETGRNLPTAPKTIWQTLNHLIIWQNYQLKQLKQSDSDFVIDEQITWIKEEQCSHPEELDKAITTFKNQLNQVKQEIVNFDLEDSELPKKIKIIQDLSVHLSFHIGEIILIRRMTGHYPLPHQMKDFLN